MRIISIALLFTLILSSCRTEAPTSVQSEQQVAAPYKVIYSVSAENIFILNGIYTDQEGTEKTLSGTTPWSITIRDIKDPNKVRLKGYLSARGATRSINGEASITITDAKGRIVYTETDKFGPVKALGFGFLTNHDIAHYTAFDLGIN